MKKTIGYLSIILIILFVCCFCSNRTITTSSKQVFEGINDEKVTLRDLALLMSLVYEDVPNAKNYNSTASDDCYDDNNNFIGGCGYIFYKNQKYNREGFNVFKYIEGMSARKLNWFTALTTVTIEDGELYYFLEYADTSEGYDWKIDNLKSERTLGNSNAAIMDAVTFRNGNNYVIAYRGTDFPDVLEWMQNLFYAKGEHAQADAAYAYAQSEYDRIIAANPNANIYVTGHSLGGYLAQIGGIAIVEKEQQLGVSNNSRLAQVAYFNGMGISAIGIGGNNIDKWIQDLEYLATHDRTGRKITSNERVTNYGTPSSGRLVLYQMGSENAGAGDPVSELGIHFGEVIRLEAAKDSVNYHNGSHQLFVNGSWKDWFSAIPTTIEEYINESLKKLKNLSLESVIQDVKSSFSKKKVNTMYTEAVSNTIYIMANASEISSDDVLGNLEEKNLHSKLKTRLQTASKTLGGLGSLFSGIVSTGLTSVIESANVYHETDSFLCLADETGGIPKVTVQLYHGEEVPNNNVILFNGDTTKENPDEVSTVYYAGDEFKLYIESTNGCARNYEVFETTGGSRIPVALDDTIFEVSKSQAGTTANVRTFEIRVYYGNKLNMMVLEDGKYVVNNTEGDYNNYVTHKVDVVYDNAPPVCKAFYQKNLSDLTKKNEKYILEFTCTDDSYVDNELINPWFHYGNETTYSKYLNASTDDITVTRISKNEIRIKYLFKVKDSATSHPIFLRTWVKDSFGNKQYYDLGGIITNIKK